MDLLVESFEAGQRILATRSAAARKIHGQYLTPPTVARYMADQLGTLPKKFSILDPAVGSGMLLCAVIERLINENITAEVQIDAYEIDPILYETAASTLERAQIEAEKRGLRLNVHVHCHDYVLAETSHRQQSLFTVMSEHLQWYDFIIANPPYFKLNSDDPRSKTSRALVGTHTNIYTLFMALAINSLAPSGKSVFIVPRSFCSGAYFAHFRSELAQQATVERLHLFESRGQNFEEVLQENVIVTFSQRDRHTSQTTPIVISTSQNGGDIENAEPRHVPASLVLHQHDRSMFYRLPTEDNDAMILRSFDGWNGSLHGYNMEVSTGRVVAFRAEAYLALFASEDAVPLLWMQHVKSGIVRYPLVELRKPQWIQQSPDTETLLVPVLNYVLLRRFSAKEEPRRLVAGAFLSDDFLSSTVGFENHLNYIYRKQDELSDAEVKGLTALYNSALFDRYFRITNGNTQVNAAELRSLPLPPLEIIQSIGAVCMSNPLVDVDQLVLDQLFEANLIPSDLLIAEKI
ncbi:MAG: SAM-dependent methyltransferase [Anaerolineae bacterium]|nr:SAM-dependent methyltransferase [Anaerolineae bacterium]NUQ05204.1 N-6 DNA methylase [Anaerolineae bacterium]